MKKIIQALSRAGVSIGTVIFRMTRSTPAPDANPASSSSGFMARNDGHSQRNASGNSWSTAIQTMPGKLKISNGGPLMPSQEVAIRLIMPLRGLSSMIQPFTRTTAGITIGASTTMSAIGRTRASVRSTIQTSRIPTSRTNVAVTAANSSELSSAGYTVASPQARTRVSSVKCGGVAGGVSVIAPNSSVPSGGSTR